jgi:hypothetical protein
MPVILAIQEAKIRGWRIKDSPCKKLRETSFQSCCVWWCTFLVLATWEAIGRKIKVQTQAKI